MSDKLSFQWQPAPDLLASLYLNCKTYTKKKREGCSLTEMAGRLKSTGIAHRSPTHDLKEVSLIMWQLKSPRKSVPREQGES